MHEGSKRFHELLNEIGKLHDKKQQDYGSDSDPFANVRASERWGIPSWVGALVRLNDKVARLQTFARKGALANESAEDSMLDIAVYALIAKVLYEQESEGEVDRMKNELEAAADTSTPMGEVQYSSTEQFHSQAVLHDPNHSESEGAWHYHHEGDAFECKPADIRSKPHDHRKLI